MIRTKLIVNLTRGHCVCVGELADRPLRRMRGLIGRRGLPAGEGLLVSPAPAIHTAFMRFPIDALFLDRDLRVLDIVEQLPPWRVAAKSRAHAVLELSAGESARRGVAVGDRLELRDRREMGAVLAGAPYGGEVDSSGRAITPAPLWREGELARVQPLRILVISRDSQFRTVISLLLARRNCAVTSSANANRLAELVERDGSDVVVIDSDQAGPAAAASKVQALEGRVGVVLVADQARSQPAEPAVLAKWGPFANFVEAIEHADRQRGVSGGGNEPA
jgi:uncharacterized protein